MKLNSRTLNRSQQSLIRNNRRTKNHNTSFSYSTSRDLMRNRTSDHACNLCHTFGHSDDLHSPRARLPTSNLNANTPHTAFCVRRGHHWKSCGESIPSSCRHTGSDSLKLWQRVLQQHRIRHLRAITVICANRFREPAQFTPAASWAAEPISVVPSNRLASERIVVLVGTIRTAGSVQCDVGLVDRIEVANGVMY